MTLQHNTMRMLASKLIGMGKNLKRKSNLKDKVIHVKRTVVFTLWFHELLNLLLLVRLYI